MSDVQLASASPYAGARAIEQALGDPFDEERRFSLRRVVELDEREAYPDELLAELAAAGVAEMFVPAELGGSFRTLEGLAAVVRVVARRDLTTAVAASQSFLGAAPIWIAGEDAQQARLAAILRAGGRLSLALSEEAHGSDLAATDVCAVRDGDGWRLDGEKWLVGHGARAAAAIVLARTEPGGGPRGFSLFFVDCSEGVPSGYVALPKLRTNGVRGAEVSGMRFDRCKLPANALVGALGGGLDIVLRALLVSRAGCAHLSLGSADTGLRLAMDLAVSRRLYGRRVFDLPHARATLTGALLDLLVCEALAVAVVRAAHVVPQQLALLAAAAKAFVPATVDAILRDAGLVLGARAHLREHFRWGAFQKLARDNTVVAVFDGSTVVNLASIAAQLWATFRRHDGRRVSGRLREGRLAQVFRLDETLPPFDPSSLTLDCRGRDDLIAGLWSERDALVPLCAASRADSPSDTLDALEADLTGLRREHERIGATLERLRSDGREALLRSPVALELARRYGCLLAAAACVQLWTQNVGRLRGFLSSAEGLRLCLDRLLVGFAPERSLSPPAAGESAARELERMHRDGQFFSLLPLQIASCRAGPPTDQPSSGEQWGASLPSP